MAYHPIHEFLYFLLLDGFPQSLGPIDDAEKTAIDPEAWLQQALEEVRTDPLVLRSGLDETQDHLVTRESDPQGDDHLILLEGFAIQEEGDEVVRVQPTLTRAASAPFCQAIFGAR